MRLTPFWGAVVAAAADKAPVTYGSALIFQHATANVRLYSARLKWGFGSREQIVTGFPAEDHDVNYFWHVRPPTTHISPEAVELNEGATGEVYLSGNPVSCGSTVRLEHAETGNYLGCSSMISSPITKSAKEIAASSGPTPDQHDWKVICKGKIWSVDTEFSLQHVKTGAYLGVQKNVSFNQSNCPRCPVVGHYEVAGLTNKKQTDNSLRWKVRPGILLDRLVAEDTPSSRRDEL